MATMEHKMVIRLMRDLAEVKYGFKGEIEPNLGEHIPDVRLTHKDYYPVHVEGESKGGKYKWRIKKEKTDKFNVILLYLDLRPFEFESRTVTWTLDQLDTALQEAMQKAEAPVWKIRYTVDHPWLQTLVVGEEYPTPRREIKYRYYSSMKGKLGEIEVLVNKTWTVRALGRITDVKRIEKNKIKDGRILNEYNLSVYGHDKKDEDGGKIPIVYWECVEGF